VTGIKNFNNTDKIKAQFSQNKGIILEWDKSANNTIIDHSNRVKANTSNVPHRMDFCLFVKSFELIGRKLHPERNLDQAFVIFVEKDIKKLLAENDQIFTEKRKINDLLFNIRKGESIEVLRDIHPLIFPHYENYSNPKGLMNFDTYFNFYKDYSIFPEMTNLILLKNIYFTLTDIYSRQLNNVGGQINYSRSVFESITKQNVTASDNPQNIANRRAINKNEYINYDLFLDSLALTANLMKNSAEYKTSDKMLYLLEKISHSEGAKKCLLKSGKTFYTSKEYIDHAYTLRMKYRGFYGKKEAPKDETKQKKFEDIFD